MPQFDPAVWPPLLIWLAITFIILYFLMWKVALPRVAEILEDRESRINESLRRAERLKLDAEEAIANYEKLMADARAKAHEVVRGEHDRAAELSAARQTELSERLAKDIAAAEQRIHAARSEALLGLRDVAVSVANDAVQRLIGDSIDVQAVSAAVDATIGETRS